jgi:hypothetical protein
MKLVLTIDLAKFNHVLNRFGVSLVPEGVVPPATTENTAPEIPDAEAQESLIDLLDRLEHGRLDFVGVGYFLKLLVRNNLVPHSQAAQRWFNELVEEKIVETYTVSNQKAEGNPVSACKLNQEHKTVSEVLDRLYTADEEARAEAEDR